MIGIFNNYISNTLTHGPPSRPAGTPAIYLWLVAVAFADLRFAHLARNTSDDRYSHVSREQQSHHARTGASGHIGRDPHEQATREAPSSSVKYVLPRHIRRASRGPRADLLGADAKVTKRPLLRPAIPSPYAGAQEAKVVYVSARTPFLGAVKRVEKLLHLADKRLVQSATTIAKQGRGKRKRHFSASGEDQILDIATEVERQKAQKRRKTDGEAGRTDEDEVNAGEEVSIKGTGRAIAKALEMALWFQQRDDQYRVRVTTGTVTAIDDIEVEEPSTPEKQGEEVADGEQDGPSEARREVEELPESRMRYTSVLEVAVSLR